MQNHHMALNDDDLPEYGELLNPSATLVSPTEISFVTDMVPHRAIDLEPDHFALLGNGDAYIRYVETYAGRPWEGDAGLQVSEPIEPPQELVVMIPGYRPQIIKTTHAITAA